MSELRSDGHSTSRLTRNLEVGSMCKLGLSRAACTFVFFVATLIVSPAQTFTTLFNFDATNGLEPYETLVQGTDGNLYGATAFGGTSSNCAYSLGCGTVFKITPTGTLTTLYNFCAQTNCTDGAVPDGGLVLATDGNFYGTTTEGGSGSNVDCQAQSGCGTVFRITPGGTLTTLYNFDLTDGESPLRLVEAANRNFYGTTYSGGANSYGTVFMMTSDGVLTTLHNFNSTDGANPQGGLFQSVRSGKLWGTTFQGGRHNLGTVYTITVGGTLKTLHSFNGNTDGFLPYGDLIQGTDGNFYGTTYDGVGGGHFGTIFKITPKGVLTTLHSFAGPEGAESIAGLVQGTDGNFYGTTHAGGNNNYGTVFEITSAGTLTTLHFFDSTDGAQPSAVVMQDTNGTFYGTTSAGGNGSNLNCQSQSGCGTVFSLSVGLGAFVKTLPISGTVGTAVTILGTNLTGASSVSFNGTTATFTVVSSSEITTDVPAGATTGFVTVVTPTGTLTSNRKFRVRP